MPRNQPGALPDQAKDFAVLCFARFMTPTQVAEAVNERFGTPARPKLLDKRTAQHYDPTTKMGQTLGNKRKVLFQELRKRVLDELEEIPIASRAMRLHQMQRHYEGALEKGNVGLSLRILEQAAKEAGGFHTNERHVHHSGVVKVDVTEDEMRGGLAAAIAQALDDMKRDQASVTKH